MIKLPKLNDQNGALNLLLILIILFGFAIGLWVFFNRSNFFSQYQKSATTQTNQTTTQAKLADKKDPKWLENYCKEETAKLPEAPFTYEKKRNTYLTRADTYILARIPEDKKYKEKTCQLDYIFEDKIAYPSLGIEYKFDIKYTNLFQEKVDQIVSSKMDSSWKKISPIPNPDAGRYAFSYKGFPLVFTRENSSTGTIDYAYFDWGSKTFYVSITTYEK